MVRALRFGLSVFLAFGMTLILTFVAAVPSAQAATFPVPDPLGVPGMTIKAGLGSLTGNKGQDLLAVMIQQTLVKLKDARAVQAAKTAVTAGVATADEVAVVAARKASFGVMATKAAPLIKGVGAAGAVFAAYQTGGYMTNGALDLLGFDATGKVCRNVNNDITGDMVAFFAGADCASFAPDREFITNADTAVVSSAQDVCGLINSKQVCYNVVRISMKAAANGQPDSSYVVVRLIPRPSSGSGSMTAWSGSGERLEDQLRDCYGATYAAFCSGFTNDRAVRWAGFPAASLSKYAFGSVTTDGAAKPISGTHENPERTLECRTTSTTGVQTNGFSRAFREDDPIWDMPLCEGLPEGQIFDHSEVILNGGPEELTLQEESATTPYKEFVQLSPECQDGSCIFDLQKNGVSCFEGTVNCADWFDDPAKESTYQCKQGAGVYALSKCNTYRPSFKPENQQSGYVYGDPETGADLTVKTAPGLGENAMADGASKTACLPSGWGALNPIEWVLKPVQCAMAWAFVPKESVIQGFKDRTAARFNTSSFSMASRVLAPMMLFDIGSGGCQGLPWGLHYAPWGLDWNGSLFNACEEPMAGVAATVRTLGTVVLATAGTLAVLRYIANIVGYAGFGMGSSGGGGPSNGTSRGATGGPGSGDGSTSVSFGSSAGDFVDGSPTQAAMNKWRDMERNG